jgi:hypothetical protein
VPEYTGPARAEPVARLADTLPGAEREWVRGAFSNQ